MKVQSPMSNTTQIAGDEMQQRKLELGDYCEFYSHLAIQARRASRVALLASSVALVAMISAILVQLKPPILLRVQDGKVSSLNASGVEVAQTAAQQQPDEAEKLSFVSGFLDRFVNIDPVMVKRNTTTALNQMTNTLRQHILAQLNEQHFVDTVRDNNVTATLAVKSAELVSGDPYSAVVFGQKRITTLINGQENKKELLVKYMVRLAPVPRVAGNGWTGLEIAEYKEEVLQQ
jgi:type IV secretory pathway component VirB8